MTPTGVNGGLTCQGVVGRVLSREAERELAFWKAAYFVLTGEAVQTLQPGLRGGLLKRVSHRGLRTQGAPQVWNDSEETEWEASSVREGGKNTTKYKRKEENKKKLEKEREAKS